MNRTQSFLRGSILSGGSIFVSMAAMLAVGKMFTNTLGQAEVAVFALLLLAADFLNILNNFGLWVALPKLVSAAEASRRNVIIGSSIRIQALVSLALGGLIVALWAVFPAPVSTTESSWRALFPYLWMLPPLFIIGTLRDTAMACLAGLNRYGHRAGGIVASAAAQVLLVYLFVWMRAGGVIALTWATIAAYGLALFWLMAALPHGARLRFDFRVYRDNVRFSLPLYVNSLLTFCFQRFDTILIAFLLKSPEAVAIYEMAKRLPTLLSRSLGALLVPFLPSLSQFLAQKDLAGASRLVNRTSSLTAVLGYSAVLAVVFVQRPLIVLLFNVDYLPATAVLGSLLTAIAIGVQTGIMGQSLIALDRPQTVTYVNLAASGLSVILNVLLIPHFGISGACAAAVLTALLSYVAQTWAVQRSGLTLDGRQYLKPQVLFLACAGIIGFGGGGTLCRGIALAAFVAGCFALRVVTPALLRQSLSAVFGRR